MTLTVAVSLGALGAGPVENVEFWTTSFFFSSSFHDNSDNSDTPHQMSEINFGNDLQMQK